MKVELIDPCSWANKKPGCGPDGTLVGKNSSTIDQKRKLIIDWKLPRKRCSCGDNDLWDGTILCCLNRSALSFELSPSVGVFRQQSITFDENTASPSTAVGGCLMDGTHR